MNNLPIIEAEVTFIPETEGGRKTPPSFLSDCSYRPHIVIGDPNQRQAILDGNFINEIYLGVAFKSNQENIEFNKPFLAELVLMHYPNPIYESLVPGITFTIREGAQIVGYGQVKRLHIHETTT